MIGQAMERLPVLAAAAVFALLISFGLITLLRPWLARHAVAQPNVRSSHRAPTPQGGGIAVVIATLAAAWVLSAAWLPIESGQLLPISAAAGLLAVVGAIDDVRSLPTAARLLMHCIAVGAVVAALPNELRLLPQLPFWIERAGLLLGGVWFVNLVNFMDGIDWMTVAEVVPITGAMVVLGIAGTIAPAPAAVAAALLGATLGFAPFNRPVARLFLGDVGSLPIGIALGWLLLDLAGRGHRTAALILPLYYLADATITLARRIARGEPFWLAHRTHFYQRATDNGFSVAEIVGRVFLVNLALAVLALIAVAASGIAVPLVSLAVAVAIVALLLMSFARARRRPKD